MQLNQVEKRGGASQVLLGLSFAIAFFSIASANAKSEFTCEKIKDKATRASCIEDRAEQKKIKAEISPSCTLNGRGDAECTFRNTGNVKGSYCGYLVLMPQSGRHPLAFIAKAHKEETLAVYNSTKTLAKLELAQEGKDAFHLHDQVGRYAVLFENEEMLLGHTEICSGLVEVGDIRKATASVRFFIEDYDLPSQVCGSSNRDVGKWSDLCSFVIVPSEQVISKMNAELRQSVIEPSAPTLPQKTGAQLSENEQVQPALAILLKKAEQGDAVAQNNLGMMYVDGNVVQKNLTTALSWFEKSARSGLPNAQTSMGWAYMSDEFGLAPNYALAMEWNLKAANQGFGEGAANVGLLYENGWGMPISYAEAASWYKKAISQNAHSGQAEFQLAGLYEKGLGVNQDLNKAIELYRTVVKKHGASADAEKAKNRLARLENVHQ